MSGEAYRLWKNVPSKYNVPSSNAMLNYPGERFGSLLVM